MKAFLNKKITKKIIIVLAIMNIFGGIFANCVHAATDTENGGKLLEPIEKFVVYICDKTMQWLQTTFTSPESIEPETGTFNFQYSPAVIFSGTVPAFDIDFIGNDHLEVEKTTTSTELQEVTPGTLMVQYDIDSNPDKDYGDNTWYDGTNGMKTMIAKEEGTNYGNLVDKTKNYCTGLAMENGLTIEKIMNNMNGYDVTGISKTTLNDILDRIDSQLTSMGYLPIDRTIEGYTYIQQMVTKTNEETGSDEEFAIKIDIYSPIDEDETSDILIRMVFTGTKEMREVEVEGTTKTYTSTAGALQSTIATWYNALRRIALIGLLSVFVYVGIRIVISSSSQDKAKYKGMIKDWVVAICLLFTLHYIMSATIFIVNEISDIFATGETDVLLNTLRTEIYQGSSWGVVVAKVIMYATLVILTITFTVQYIMRVIYMAFYTLIAPLITLTYPLDKIKDGQAQAFNMWIKEYVFTALIQVVHLVIYVVLVGSALKLVTEYPLYAIIVMLFIKKAEGIIKKMFGFEDKETVKALGAVMTGGLVMKAINQLGHKPPKGGKPGGASEKGSDSNSSVRTATNNPLGAGQGNGEGGNKFKGVANIGKSIMENHGKDLVSGAMGVGTGLAGGAIGFAAGLSQGDIGAAFSGAIAGGTAGMNFSKNLVKSVTSIPGRYNKVKNSIKDTYREGAYGEEVAKAMRFDEEFRNGSTYEAIKKNNNFSEERLQTMLNAGITEKKAMTKILDSGMDIDTAIKYYEMAQKCPDSILYGNRSTLVRYLTDRDIDEADAKIMAENIGKFK